MGCRRRRSTASPTVSISHCRRCNGIREKKIYLITGSLADGKFASITATPIEADRARGVGSYHRLLNVLSRIDEYLRQDGKPDDALFDVARS